MCLAIPGKVEEITTEGDLRMGRVNFGGVVKCVCLDYVPEVQVGDYTIVQVGFALSKIDEATALQTLEDFRAMVVLDEDLARGGQRPAGLGGPAWPWVWWRRYGAARKKLWRGRRRRRGRRKSFFLAGQFLVQ